VDEVLPELAADFPACYGFGGRDTEPSNPNCVWASLLRGNNINTYEPAYRCARTRTHSLQVYRWQNYASSEHLTVISAFSFKSNNIARMGWNVKKFPKQNGPA